MSDQCQYDTKCGELAYYECPCKEPAVLLCKKHLDMHIFTTSSRGHNIRPIVIGVLEESRIAIINEIFKLKIAVYKEGVKYTRQVQELVAKIYSKHTKGLSKLREIDTQLDTLCQLVKSIKEIRTNHEIPEIVKIFQYSPDIIPYKFDDLKLISIEIKPDKFTLKTSESISKNFPKSEVRCEVLQLIQGVCPREHPLLLSLETSNYYTFLYGVDTHPQCNLCKAAIVENNLHCRICNFDVCSSCAQQKSFIIPKRLSCPNKHTLEWLPSMSSLANPLVGCDICGVPYNCSGWRCTNCNFDMCNRCGELKGIQPPFIYPLVCLASHPMACRGVTDVTCNTCKIDLNTFGWRCKKCPYHLCLLCSNRLGHKAPICQCKQFMITHKQKGGKLYNKFMRSVIGGGKCAKCNLKVKTGDWVCTKCTNYLCISCFKIAPSNFLHYDLVLPRKSLQ